jgi:hypothetical protein
LSLAPKLQQGQDHQKLMRLSLSSTADWTRLELSLLQFRMAIDPTVYLIYRLRLEAPDTAHEHLRPSTTPDHSKQYGLVRSLPSVAPLHHRRPPAAAVWTIFSQAKVVEVWY